MNRRRQGKDIFNINVNIPFCWRILKKWLFSIICCAIIVSICTYIFMDIRLKETYTGTAIVSIIPRTNSPSSLNDNLMNTAINRNLAMWKSNSLRKIIKDSNPELKVNGYLNATNIDGSGLIRLTAKAETAENAYYLLRSALRYYHKIDNNFDTNYSAIALTRVDASSISGYRNNPLKYAIFALGGVLFGGCFLLLLWCLVTDYVYSKEQAKKLLDTAVLESVIAVKKRDKKAILISNNFINVEYLNQINRLTIRAEQILNQRKHQMLMVTSIQENEGKSTIAANLALNLAKRGNKTLLIDMDFRRPAIYKIFDKKKEKNRSISEIMDDIRRLNLAIEEREDLFGLNVLWQYKMEADSDRLIERLHLEGVLERLKRKYDFIIIDTPPIGPVRDAAVIAEHVTDTLLVVRQDFNHATEINDAIDELEEQGTSCIGIVLNNCKGIIVNNKGVRLERRYGKHRR